MTSRWKIQIAEKTKAKKKNSWAISEVAVPIRICATAPEWMLPRITHKGRRLRSPILILVDYSRPMGNHGSHVRLICEEPLGMWGPFSTECVEQGDQHELYLDGAESISGHVTRVTEVG